MRPQTPPSRWLLPSILCLSFTASGQTEEPEITPQQCLENHEKAQVSQIRGHLLPARDALRLCSSTACPAIIRNDCVRWFAEVDQAIPSVVVSARRGGLDLKGAQLSIDENPIDGGLDGAELELEPGGHVFRVEVEGLEPQQREVVISKGERGRLVLFEWEPERQSRSAEATTMPVASAPPPETHRPVPTLTYVLSGVSAVGIAGGVTLGILGKNERDDLAATGCAPYCSEDDVESVRQKLLFADLSYLVGAAAGIGALTTYFLRPSVVVPQDDGARESGVTDVAVMPAPGGGFVSVSGVLK